MTLPVMAGLVPAISLGAVAAAETDARNKSGHDGGNVRVWLTRGGREVSRAPENPGGHPFGFAQWLNRTAVEQVRP